VYVYVCMCVCVCACECVAAEIEDEDAWTLAAAPPEEMKKVEALFDTADILSLFSYRSEGRHDTMRLSNRFQAENLVRLVRDEAKMMDTERVHTFHARIARTHAHLYARTHICTHTRTHAHTYTCVSITKYAHMYIHMYIHTHWYVSFILKSHIIVTPYKWSEYTRQYSHIYETCSESRTKAFSLFLAGKVRFFRSCVRVAGVCRHMRKDTFDWACRYTYVCTCKDIWIHIACVTRRYEKSTAHEVQCVVILLLRMTHCCIF